MPCRALALSSWAWAASRLAARPPNRSSTRPTSSTARNFTTLLGDGYRARLAEVKIASIGPITTATLEELGLKPTVVAEQFNIDGLVAAILKT